MAQACQRGVILLITLVLLCASMPGCMVGPNFHSPAPPVASDYTETPLPKKTAATPGLGKGGQAQTFIDTEEISAIWWELFHSPTLNQLVKVGLANSPNLAAAYAALRQAQENVNVQIGNSLLPAFDAVGYAERQRFSPATIGVDSRVGNALFNSILGSTIFDLYYASVTVSYTFDLFGSARRQIEALRAKVDYQQYQLLAAYLSLTSNIVTTSISVSSYQAQIIATKELIREQQGLLTIFDKQFYLGGVPKTTVLTQQTLVEQTKATLPTLEKNLSRAKHALSVLVGAFPEGPLPIIDLDSLTLPATIPVSLPSDLVRQRPDIMAAEALLHSACAQLGVATANLYPKITITGADGWTSTMISTLFTPQNNIWNIIGQIAQPIFHGGALLAQRRAAIAAYQQASAQYRQTVLQAFQNVADTLRALETDARTLLAQKRAEDAARKSLALTEQQFRLGGVSYINLLNVQQQYQQAKINRIQAQAARFSDTAALFQALGGGWWTTKILIIERTKVLKFAYNSG